MEEEGILKIIPIKMITIATETIIATWDEEGGQEVGVVAAVTEEAATNMVDVVAVVVEDITSRIAKRVVVDSQIVQGLIAVMAVAVVPKRKHRTLPTLEEERPQMIRTRKQEVTWSCRGACIS